MLAKCSQTACPEWPWDWYATSLVCTVVLIWTMIENLWYFDSGFGTYYIFVIYQTFLIQADSTIHRGTFGNHICYWVYSGNCSLLSLITILLINWPDFRTQPLPLPLELDCCFYGWAHIHTYHMGVFSNIEQPVSAGWHVFYIPKHINSIAFNSHHWCPMWHRQHPNLKMNMMMSDEPFVQPYVQLSRYYYHAVLLTKNKVKKSSAHFKSMLYTLSIDFWVYEISLHKFNIFP